jgi:four helix bundle protein
MLEENDRGGNMAETRSHRDLLAWKEAMGLVETVYKQTAAFPRNEVFGLAVQMRRSAVSVPSNIAEGAARNSSREYYQYLGIATGSVAELETQLELAARLGYLSQDSDALQHVRRVGRLVNALRNSIGNRIGQVQRSAA